MTEGPKWRFIFIINRSDDSSTRQEYDFRTMTWRIAQTGGYRNPDESGRIAEDVAEIFWRECLQLIKRAEMESVESHLVGGETWTAIIEDGPTTQQYGGKVIEPALDGPTNSAFMNFLELIQKLPGIMS